MTASGQIWSTVLYSRGADYRTIPAEEGINPSPSVTVNITSGKALVTITSRKIGGSVKTSFAITGSTSRDGDFHQSLDSSTSMTFAVEGLNNGPNTFTLVYTISSDKLYVGEAVEDRSIIVVPLP